MDVRGNCCSLEIEMRIFFEESLYDFESDSKKDPSDYFNQIALQVSSGTHITKDREFRPSNSEESPPVKRQYTPNDALKTDDESFIRISGICSDSCLTSSTDGISVKSAEDINQQEPVKFSFCQLKKVPWTEEEDRLLRTEVSNYKDQRYIPWA